MYKTLIIICCVICGLQAQDITIPWNDTYNLTWKDFKGPIDQSSKAVATTASGITFGYSLKMSGETINGFTTDITTHFYPDKSWYKPNQVDANVLAHEQLHFNITELFARKFRKQIEALKVSNAIKTQLNTLHQEINTALAKMQNQYDNETNFSINTEHQQQWQVYIQEELNKLNNYKYQNQ